MQLRISRSAKASKQKKLDAEGGEATEKPVYTVNKFSGITTTTTESSKGLGLAEAVIIGGRPLFAYISIRDRGDSKI
jgi:hypothetical protein